MKGKAIYMRFLKRNILECQEGDIIASDIYNDNDSVLLIAKDTIINEYIIKRLSSIGVRDLCIYQRSDEMPLYQEALSESKLSPEQTIKKTKDMFQEIVSGKEVSLEDLTAVTEQIYSTLKVNHTVEQCLTMMRDSDEYTYSHSINVAFYSMMIGQGMKLTENEIRKAFLSGLLHDIGKTKVPEEILNKPGQLTESEQEVIRSHTILGNGMVDMIFGLDQDVKNAVLLHHERMDGSGYPFHFTKNNINLYSSIVAVADVFDAMTTDRVYISRRTPFDVFKIFLSEGLTKFDIRVIDAFVRKVANNMIGCKVQLNSGEVGEIIYMPYQNLMKPIIKLSKQYIDLSNNNEVQIVKMM